MRILAKNISCQSKDKCQIFSSHLMRILGTTWQKTLYVNQKTSVEYFLQRLHLFLRVSIKDIL